MTVSQGEKELLHQPVMSRQGNREDKAAIASSLSEHANYFHAGRGSAM